MTTKSAPAIHVFDPTDRQYAIFDAIYESARDKGYQPSYRDLAARFHIRSPHGVSAHIKALARKGFLKMEGDSRALCLLRRPDGTPFDGFADDPPLETSVVGDILPRGQLTARQAEMFGFFYHTTRDAGFQPSIYDAMAHFGVKSPNGITQVMGVFQKKGWVNATGHARGIEFLRRPDGSTFRGFSDKPR